MPQNLPVKLFPSSLPSMPTTLNAAATRYHWHGGSLPRGERPTPHGVCTRDWERVTSVARTRSCGSAQR